MISLVCLARITFARITTFAILTPRPPTATITYKRNSPSPVLLPLGKIPFIFSTTLFMTNLARASLSLTSYYSFIIVALVALCFFVCFSCLIIY